MYFKKLLLLGFTVLASMCLYSQNNMDVIAHFEGEHHSSGYGFSMVSLDFNHDGYDDLAVCSFAYGYIYGQVPARGKVYIYNGGHNFNSYTPASVNMEGTYANSTGRRIWAIYKVGDISGDGFGDLCVYVEDHVSWNESYEKLLFYYGGTNNLDTPDYVINLSGNIYQFGSIFKIGDMNGDGYGDMGISYTATPPPAYQNYLSIIWGGSYNEHPVSVGECSFSNSVSINGIGDINNDGYADFTTGFTTPPHNPTSNIMRLFYGNSEGNTDNPIVMSQYGPGSNRTSKPLGDLNSDGYDDYMGYVTNLGMHVWLGGESINYAIPDFNLDPAWYGDEFTRSLDYGDFNNDGFDDVVGANYGERQFSVWLGKLHVNGVSDWITGQNIENFGSRLVTGDFNANGFCDIAIAAPYEYIAQPTGDFYGFIWVYGGNADLADTTVANDDPTIPGITEQMRVQVSPNPVTLAEGSISIFFNNPKHKSSKATLEIYNVKGQRVVLREINLTTSQGNCSISVSSLSSGVYVCLVRMEQSSASAKFTIIK